MNDPLDIYNNTANAVVLTGTYTVPANGYISIADIDAQNIAKMPFFQFNLVTSVLGVSVYGQDLSYGLNSAADIWMQRVAAGSIAY